MARSMLGKRILTPSRMLLGGFALFILLGAFLLSLPISAVGEPLSFTEALFTATSSVCVTGLTLIDPGTRLTFFGQLMLILLIQAGGLGFMTISTLLMLALRRRITLRERMVIQTSWSEDTLSGLVKLTLRIVVLTFMIEGAGALLLITRFIPRFGPVKGLWYSIFHAISAFCNAGFDLFGGMQTFRNDPVVLLVICILITLGGIGFSVMFDLKKQDFRLHRITLHSKLVLVMSLVLTVAGTVLFAVFEWNNPQTLAAPELHPAMKPIAALFQSVTCRTAGFYTIDQGALRPTSWLLTLLLMFIGASPASTGGGIKTTTFTVFILLVYNVLRGRPGIQLFKRTLPQELVNRSTVLLVLAFILIVLSYLGLTLLMPVNYPQSKLLYEVVSAFGTVGMTMGATAELTQPAKLLICLVMYIGRVGLLTLAVGLSRRTKVAEQRIEYPNGKIIIG